MKRPIGLVTVAALSLLLLPIHCTQPAEKTYRLVTAKGPVSMHDFSRYYIACAFNADSAAFITMPARNGDLLEFSNDANDFYELLQADTPDTLALEWNDSTIVMGGHLHTLNIKPDRHVERLIMSATPEILSKVRTLILNEPLNTEQKDAVEHIAKINHRPNLVIIKDTLPTDRRTIEWLAGLFNPPFISFELSEKGFPVLEKFDSARLMYLGIADTIVRQALPRVAGVRELFLGLQSGSTRLVPDLFRNNPQLEVLNIYGSFDPSDIDWSTLPNLKDLRIIAENSLHPYAYGKALPKLQSLHLFGYSRFKPGDFTGLHRLRELGIPSDMSQDNIDQLIRENRQLSMLLVYNADTMAMSDWSVLKQAKHLDYLLVTADTVFLEDLLPLSGLKYLSLPADIMKDSIAMARLQKALPNTVISANDGACMGTGWILLIVPVAIGVTIVMRMLNRKTVARA